MVDQNESIITFLIFSLSPLLEINKDFRKVVHVFLV